VNWKFLTFLWVSSFLFQFLFSKDSWTIKIGRVVLLSVALLLISLPLAWGVPVLIKLPDGMGVVLIFFYQIIILGLFIYLLHSDGFRVKMSNLFSRRICEKKNESEIDSSPPI
jgi:hypothetical protein